MNKQEKKKILRNYRYPNTCFCSQDGDSPEYGELLRTEIWDGHPIYQRNEKISVGIYRCNKCGKEVSDCPAFA